MVKFKGFEESKNERKLEAQRDLDLVLPYKCAILDNFRYITYDYDANGEKNLFFAYDKIDLFRADLKKDFDNNIVFHSIDNLEAFHGKTSNLVYFVYGFFLAINLYNHNNQKAEQHILSNKSNIDISLKQMGQFDLTISKIEDSQVAKSVQKYCLEVIKKSENFIRNNLFINISDSPFRNDFINLSSLIKNADTTGNLLAQRNISKNNVAVKLTMNDIALRQFYLGDYINLENAAEFLVGTGLKSERDLYNTFMRYSEKRFRTSNPENAVKLKNKIKLFEKVRNLLPLSQRQAVDGDLAILKRFEEIS